MGQAKSLRPIRRLAQRPRIRCQRQNAIRRQRHAKRPGCHCIQTGQVDTRRPDSDRMVSGRGRIDSVRAKIYVANIKGLSPGRPRKSNGKLEFNSHQYHGSLSLMDAPKKRNLPALSSVVWKNYRRERLAEAKLPTRPNQPARPVPERIGEPSVFKHVVYIIKENRTLRSSAGRCAIR